MARNPRKHKRVKSEPFQGKKRLKRLNATNLLINN
jgi:hypothetical protein